MFPLILLYVVLTIIRPQDYVPGLDTVPILPVVLLLAFAAWTASREKTFEAPQFVILPAFLLVLMISQVTNGWTGGALDEIARFGPVVIAFFCVRCVVQHAEARARGDERLRGLCRDPRPAWHRTGENRHGLDRYSAG